MKSFLAVIFTSMILAISASAWAMPRTAMHSRSSGQHLIPIYLTQVDNEPLSRLLIS
jgi:hypothetical protein